MAHLDIIIPTYGQEEHTCRCLRSIAATRGELDVRVIWVDNGSRDESRAAVELCLAETGLPCTVVYWSDNAGFVKATNRGLAESDATFICLQNNDTVAYPGLYQTLLAACALPSAGLVGPVGSSGWQDVNNLASKWGWDGYGDLTHEQIAARLRAEHGSDAWEVPRMLAFFCTMMPRSTYERLGPLDEDYGVGFGDDDDYCAKAQAAGLKLYLALGAYCEHAHRTTFRALYEHDEILRMQDRNLALYHERWGRR